MKIRTSVIYPYLEIKNLTPLKSSFRIIIDEHFLFSFYKHELLGFQ